MKLDEKYFEDVFDKIRLVWDTKHFIKIETVKLLKQIAADAREEHNGKIINILSEIINDKDLLYTIKVVRAALDRAKG